MPICLNLTEIIVAIISAVAASSFITVKIIKRNSVTQSGNTITTGDIVGRDKTGGNKTHK